RRLHFPPEQLTLTGAASDDILLAGLQQQESRRARVYRDLNLAPDRPMLLSALVPNQLVSGVPHCEFDDYDVLMDFWVSTIGSWRHKFNVVLKINPRANPEDYRHLEKHGVVIAPHDTIELVPLAEIYVASISSTLRWAAACAVPAINYDVYCFRYGDFI